MKSYLDSVAPHRIDETQSEQNSSFISVEQRKSLKDPKTFSRPGSKGQQNRHSLELVNEEDNEASRIISEISIGDQEKRNDLA